MKRNCPICNQNADYFGSVMKNDKRIGKHIIEVDKCKKCNYYFQSPVFNKDKTKSIYEEDFIVGKYEKYFKKFQSIRKQFFIEIKDYYNYNNLDIAEIGSSSGFNLETMNNIAPNNNYFGFDLDKESIKYGYEYFKENENIHLYAKDFMTIDKKYDLIILSHILEHIEDPISFIKDIKARLKKDGKIIVSVPSGNTMMESIFWEHLSYFSPESIRAIGDKADIKVSYTEEFSFTRSNSAYIELIAVFDNDKPLKHITKYSEEDKREATRIYARDWYDYAANKETKTKAKMIYKENKEGRKLKEWLLWSKLFRLFTLKWI